MNSARLSGETTVTMTADLSEVDAHAQGTAIRILTEAGFFIDGVSDVRTYDGDGVEFTITVRAPTRTPRFEPQSEAVKQAALEAPEYDFNGKEVNGDT